MSESLSHPLPLVTATTLTCDLAGLESAPPILFLHGVRLTRKMWLPQMQALSHEYRLIALDLPGHGALVDVPFQLDTAARVMADVLDSVAEGRALVVGLSLGGYVAMDFAARHPDKVAGLVLASCSAVPKGMLTYPYRLAGRLNSLVHERWRTRFNARLFRYLYGAHVADPLIEAGFYFGAWPMAEREILHKDFPARLRAYPGPTLLLNGQFDRLFRIAERLYLAAAQNGRLHIIRRAGHLANLSRPQEFNACVSHFAQTVPW